MAARLARAMNVRSGPGRAGLVAPAALALLLGLVPSAVGGYAPPQRIGTITAPVLTEVSGLAYSRSVPDGFWVVNDGGHAPALHAIDAAGRLVASVIVAGARNGDWEDLAAGPGPGGSRLLYIADIGDNDLARDDLVVYRVPEPSAGVRRTAVAERFPFRYPDGRHDAEAILVDPGSGQIFIATKGRSSRLYAFPKTLRPGTRVTLVRMTQGRGVADLARLANVTGAAVSPDGRRAVVRTYSGALELRRRAKMPFSSLFSAPGLPVSLAFEPQGEAITYTPDGRALVTTSERLPATIWRFSREG